MKIDNNNVPGMDLPANGVDKADRVEISDRARADNRAARGVGAADSGSRVDAGELAGARAAAAGAGSGLDHIQLSALGQSLRTETPGTPEREAHLDRLESQVARGEYVVDAQDLSRRLVDDILKGSAG